MEARADYRDFKHVGIIQQFSASFIRLGRVTDAIIIFASLYLTTRAFGENWNTSYAAVALIYILVFEVITSVSQMYRSWRMVRLRHELVKVSFFWLVSSALVALGIYVFFQNSGLNNRVIVAWFGSLLALIATVRVATRLLLRYVRSFGYDSRSVAFVGANDIAVRLRNTFRAHPWMGMKVVGMFDDREARADRGVAVTEQDVAGSAADLVQLARNGAVDIVYVCLPMAAELRIRTLVDTFSDTTASIYYCPSFFNFDLMNARWDDVFGQPVVSIIDSPFTGHNAIVKRTEDLALLLLLSPIVLVLLLAIAIGVASTSAGPVFFKQSRYGLDGRRFTMWKFRTMYVDHCNAAFNQATRNDPRVTVFGRFLRASSLDEVPQLYNVLKGDMSIVGPRPHPDVVNEDQRTQIHRYMMRHKVRPGITGLAQVSGFRGETETKEKMEQRIACDLEYMRSWSILLDIKILYRTLFSFRGRHVY